VSEREREKEREREREKVSERERERKRERERERKSTLERQTGNKQLLSVRQTDNTQTDRQKHTKCVS